MLNEAATTAEYRDIELRLVTDRRPGFNRLKRLYTDLGGGGRRWSETRCRHLASKVRTLTITGILKKYRGRPGYPFVLRIIQDAALIELTSLHLETSPGSLQAFGLQQQNELGRALERFPKLTHLKMENIALPLGNLIELIIRPEMESIVAKLVTSYHDDPLITAHTSRHANCQHSRRQEPLPHLDLAQCSLTYHQIAGLLTIANGVKKLRISIPRQGLAARTDYRCVPFCPLATVHNCHVSLDPRGAGISLASGHGSIEELDMVVIGYEVWKSAVLGVAPFDHFTGLHHHNGTGMDFSLFSKLRKIRIPAECFFSPHQMKRSISAMLPRPLEELEIIFRTDAHRISIDNHPHWPECYYGWLEDIINAKTVNYPALKVVKAEEWVDHSASRIVPLEVPLGLLSNAQLNNVQISFQGRSRALD
ncbi:uncharacterized protein BKCO1_5000103 [Diplodia corticola]|uniref:Uncharacterized protein n=1 Tax=Diplodia corticola TaxID=236234 RepID=A0A1J9RD38_9PEZI|nr:uncharacterized protein BKCO1_5000103 [Diplodia corticola]OJD38026.1 hypothetical protein BKCO1_5000103 [Diplodia corticola]